MDGLVEPEAELRSPSSAFEDELIMLTNDDATACKVSAITRGYWRDPYYSLFAQLHAIHQQFDLHKSPEINMGYYARVISIRAIVLAFIKKHGGKCNILNLGCGFDTLPFWLAEHNTLPSAFVEVDLPLIVVRKMKAIRSFSELSQFFPDVELTPPTSPTRTSARGHGHSRPSSVVLDATRHPELIARTRRTSHRAGDGDGDSMQVSPRDPSPAAAAEPHFQAPAAPDAKVGANRPAPLTLPTSDQSKILRHMASLTPSGAMHAVSTIEDVHMRIASPANKAAAQSDSATEQVEKLYHLVSCDIRSNADLEAKLVSCELDHSLPTLVIAECVLVYLTRERSDPLLRSLVEAFSRLQLVVFEQCNLSSTFGKIMIENLDKRGWHLLGKDVCASEKTQTERLQQVGFEAAQCQLMWNVLKELEKLDGKRFNHLEMLDERILLEQLLTHYALLQAAHGTELIDFRAALATLSVNDIIH